MINNLTADIEAYKKEVGMMKLEKLIAERESISTKKFPVPVKELLQCFEQLHTGTISDVLREFALLNQALPRHLHPLRSERTVEGLAFTVKSAPNVKITGEMTFRTQMISELTDDTMTGNFFQSTMPTMESAWRRPNAPDFHHIQSNLAAKLHAALTA